MKYNNILIVDDNLMLAFRSVIYKSNQCIHTGLIFNNKDDLKSLKKIEICKAEKNEECLYKITNIPNSLIQLDNTKYLLDLHFRIKVNRPSLLKIKYHLNKYTSVSLNDFNDFNDLKENDKLSILSRSLLLLTSGIDHFTLDNKMFNPEIIELFLNEIPIIGNHVYADSSFSNEIIESLYHGEINHYKSPINLRLNSMDFCQISQSIDRHVKIIFNTNNNLNVDFLELLSRKEEESIASQVDSPRFKLSEINDRNKKEDIFSSNKDYFYTSFLKRINCCRLCQLEFVLPEEVCFIRFFLRNGKDFVYEIPQSFQRYSIKGLSLDENVYNCRICNGSEGLVGVLVNS